MRLPTWVMNRIGGLPERFTGQIQIDCFEGGVGSMTWKQSAKAPEDACTSSK